MEVPRVIQLTTKLQLQPTLLSLQNTHQNLNIMKHWSWENPWLQLPYAASFSIHARKSEFCSLCISSNWKPTWHLVCVLQMLASECMYQKGCFSSGVCALTLSGFSFHLLKSQTIILKYSEGQRRSKSQVKMCFFPNTNNTTLKWKHWT